MSRREERRSERYFVAVILVGVPLMLNACTGNILKGEKLSLFGPNNRKANNPPGSQPGAHAPGHPGGTPQPGHSAAPPCTVTVQLEGLNPRDADVKAFNDEIASIEAARPRSEDLAQLIRKFSQDSKLDLEPGELLNLIDQVISLSDLNSEPAAEGETTPASVSAPSSANAAAPVPAPGPKSTLAGVVSRPQDFGQPQPLPGSEGGTGDLPAAGSPDDAAAAPAPYYLHPSIVAFVAYKSTASFARQLKLENKEVIGLSQSVLNMGTHELAYLAYKKAYTLASGQMDYNDVATRKWLTAVSTRFPGKSGMDLLLYWVQRYDIAISAGMPAKDALTRANEKICYTPDKDKPEAGFHGGVAGEAGAKPAAKTPKFRPVKR